MPCNMFGVLSAAIRSLKFESKSDMIFPVLQKSYYCTDAYALLPMTTTTTKSVPNSEEVLYCTYSKISCECFLQLFCLLIYYKHSSDTITRSLEKQLFWKTMLITYLTTMYQKFYGQD